MGRRSKLTEKQWHEMERRKLAGEKDGVLAKEFKISVSAIRFRFFDAHKNAKAVAHQLVSADMALRALPISAQITALNIADELRAVSMHLVGAAKYGSATAHRLAGIANAQVAKVDDADPMKSQEVLQGISALTKMSNEASSIGLNLLAANRDRMKALDEMPAPFSAAMPTDPAEAAREYLRLVSG